MTLSLTTVHTPGSALSVKPCSERLFRLNHEVNGARSVKRPFPHSTYRYAIVVLSIVGHSIAVCIKGGSKANAGIPHATN